MTASLHTNMRGALNGALRVTLVVTVVIFVLLAIAPRFGAYRTLSVLSGSMTPTFRAGDLLVLRPEPLRDVRVGQVLTYAIPVGNHHIESHRIVRILHGGANPVVRTQGDANTTPDPWTAQLHGSEAWHVVATVPYAAWPILFLRRPLVHDLGLFGAPALLVLLGLLRIWRTPTSPGATPRTVHAG